MAATVVIKNYDPLVFGSPVLAIDTTKGLSCFKLSWNSSSNSPPQILSPIECDFINIFFINLYEIQKNFSKIFFLILGKPPVPSPLGSPV